MQSDDHRRFRPSDLLPWADPHIRALVEQLQDEVRCEVADRATNRLEEYWRSPEEPSFLDGTFHLDGTFEE